jgi:hypothetical protein
VRHVALIAGHAHVCLHQLIRLCAETKVLRRDCGGLQVARRLQSVSGCRQAPWTGRVWRNPASDRRHLSRDGAEWLRMERRMEQLLRQTLDQLLNLLKLLRQYLEQLLQVMNLLLYVLQLLKLLRHDLQELLQHLLLARLNVRRLRTKWMRCEPVPSIWRRCGQRLPDVHRRRSDTVRDSRHNDSSTMFLFESGRSPSLCVTRLGELGTRDYR